MRALQISKTASLAETPEPLQAVEIPEPKPGASEVLVRVDYCGVCHTELDEIEGRAAPRTLPMIPGHQVVGEVVAAGSACEGDIVGRRVGVAWIYHSCGECRYCNEDLENLCADFCATGRDVNGGYAQFMTVAEDFVHVIPESLDSTIAAPLLCAGAVGYRALRLCELKDGAVLGLTGFGASGHLVLQMARHLYPSSPVFVFARSAVEREFALELGADWTGDTREQAPRRCDAIIDTTPAWLPVLCALESLAPGGRLVINAIRKESGDQDTLATLDYDRHLWREKSLRSVANVTRNDVRGCLELAAQGAVSCHVEIYPLESANTALQRIRQGGLRGALVLRVTDS